MGTLVPLLVVVPLTAAALLAAVARWLPRGVPDLVAILVAGFVTAAGVVLLVGTHDEPLVTWFAGWQPVHGLAVGISFVVDPISATMVVLAGLLTFCSLVFSWRYFEEVGHLYHSLILAFLGGMVGFSLSADLFNIFVWLELMSVAAYALCGYQIHQARVVQGAVNFAIVNSLGTFTMLMGIALVYGATGQLNLAAIGEHLAGHGAPRSVVVGFAFVTVGLLVKAGAVPFHFWLSDAYAVAAAPVGALFAGVMSDLAYHTFARVYWDAFAAGLAAHADAVRAVLVTVAVATAVVGAVMCWLQSDLKRQVAFLTISHGGIFLAGIGLLTPLGLAGATLYLVTDGVLKAALFLSFAVVILRLGSSDELALHGRGRSRDFALPAFLFLACGVGLAAAPPLGTFVSSAMIYDSPGYRWLPPVLAVCAALTAATVLRAAARIYLGWGTNDDPLLTSQASGRDEGGEPDDGRELSPGTRTLLLTPALFLVAIGFGLSFVPGVPNSLIGAAHGAEHHTARAALVLHDEKPPPPPASHYHPSPRAWGYGAGSATGALLLAGAGLWWPRRRLPRWVVASVNALKGVHDGSVGDYATWLTAGAGLITAVWAVTLR